jgi:DNA-binding NtrC family response regulator
MKTGATILIAEDELDMLNVLRKMLSRAGYAVEGVATGTEARKKLEEKVYDVVITDLKLPGPSGIDVLRKLKEISPDTVGIVITGYGTVETAVEAMKLGAYEFIPKPFDMKRIKVIIRNALEQSSLASENRYLRRSLDDEWQVEHIIGTTPVMKTVFDAVAKVAPTDATVLITGESGTGKELIARYIHHMSPRRDGLFTAVNCGVLREVFLESELFGHVKGAFTGAVSAKRGLLEIAHGGTFFLDEIAEVSLPVQVKLLRVLEERSFMRLGGTETIHVDIRLIAATNKDLERCIAEGSFREDLYYRLNVFSISVPSLRERGEDMAPLAYYFLRKHCRKLGKHITEISPEALEALRAYGWPGNVRELENAIERASILATGSVLTTDHLPGKIVSNRAEIPSLSPGTTYRAAKKRLIETFDRTYVRTVLRKHKGNVTHASQEAGMDRANFQRLIRKSGLKSEFE